MSSTNAVDWEYLRLLYEGGQSEHAMFEALADAFPSILAERTALIADYEAMTKQRNAHAASGQHMATSMEAMDEKIADLIAERDAAREALKQIAAQWGYSDETMDRIRTIARTAIEGGKRE